MTKIIIILLISIALFTGCNKSIQPVNPNASKEVKEMLAWMYENQGKYILSGQHNYGHEMDRSSDSIEVYTGKRPVVWGCDFASANLNKLVDEIIRQHENGSVITLMFHMRRPFDADTVKRSTWKKLTDEQWKDLVTPGTQIHGLWQTQMDSVAFYLKKVQDANIPVLWRPFHEMNGIWFWWGNRPGTRGYQQMWKLLYDRFTNYHKLNNLIWVWNANAPRNKNNDEAFDYHLFYPGNEYVDVLAADVYDNDYKQSHHDQLVKLGKGKLIALGEIGDVPTPEKLALQSQWSWFMVWAHFPWTHNTPEEIKALYDDPKVLNLDEINVQKIIQRN